MAWFVAEAKRRTCIDQRKLIKRSKIYWILKTAEAGNSLLWSDILDSEWSVIIFECLNSRQIAEWSAKAISGLKVTLFNCLVFFYLIGTWKIWDCLEQWTTAKTQRTSSSLMRDNASSVDQEPWHKQAGEMSPFLPRRDKGAKRLHHTLGDYHVSWCSPKLVKLLLSEDLTRIPSKQSFVITRRLTPVVHYHPNAPGCPLEVSWKLLWWRRLTDRCLTSSLSGHLAWSPALSHSTRTTW